MKAEINNENKAKFFAMYWGQEIYRIEGRSTKLIATGSSFSEKDYIELKPLSQISDEDAIEVGLIHVDGLHPVKAEWIREYLNAETELTYKEVDYLRSTGHALPWMGLSVDEMINAGWIKLTNQ